MRTGLFKLVMFLVPTLVGMAQHNSAIAGQEAVSERGRYLLVVGGCNDCHSPGYAESGGSLPTSQWLIGSDMGFQGPWGTTYPGNLRKLVAAMTEEQWVARARTPMRPPMPSPSLMAMTERDLKAIYHFIRELGPKGEDVPAYVPPGQTVTTSFINFAPVSQP